MTAFELIICSLLLTLTLTYIFVNTCDPKQLVKMSRGESIVFAIFMFLIIYIAVYFFLAAITGFIF